MTILLDGVTVNRTEAMIWQYQHSVTKRKILQTWRQDKRRFLNSLIRDDVSLNPTYAVQFYKNFRALLWQSYREEFPEEKPNIDQLCDWLKDNATICNHLGKQQDRNTWLDIRKCTKILIDGNLL